MTAAPPLEGLLVVELGHMLAAPGAGMILADLGADVVKVESLTGDPARELQTAAFTGTGTSPSFLAFNRNKRSIAIDLQQSAGAELVRRMAARADVLIESFRPGVMARLGLSLDELRAANPGLICASLSGFGDEGPDSSRRGVDLVIQAESGIMAVTGEADGPPLKVGFTVVDVAAGHVLAQAVLAALVRRGRTGDGDEITVSLVDVALHLQAAPMTEYLATGTLPPRVGNAAPMTAPADVFRTADGHLVISAYLERHWRALCASLGRPELTEDPRFVSKADRVRNRDALVTELETALGARGSRQWLEELREAGLVVGVVKTYADIEADAQVRAMGTIVEVGGRDGYRSVRLPARYRSWQPDYARGAPAVGEDGENVLAGFGYDETEIRGLVASGVVGAGAKEVPT